MSAATVEVTVEDTPYPYHITVRDARGGYVTSQRCSTAFGARCRAKRWKRRIRKAAQLNAEPV